ncbi:hypothetical protein B0H34DRAFT_728951 [Crassisporium funariophilum]|nr:hypothetical protein B0H34DRAFT_728951 [Crassisporium funariophilum]
MHSVILFYRVFHLTEYRLLTYLLLSVFQHLFTSTSANQSRRSLSTRSDLLSATIFCIFSAANTPTGNLSSLAV